jgi:mRNA-degrading endonuclease toxin of MazEF toxin-antitoxin module
LINLDPTIGAEIKKTRPAVIMSDDAVGVLPLKVSQATRAAEDISPIAQRHR